jgi:hypothetical protein
LNITSTVVVLIWHHVIVIPYRRSLDVCDIRSFLIIIRSLLTVASFCLLYLPIFWFLCIIRSIIIIVSIFFFLFELGDQDCWGIQSISPFHLAAYCCASSLYFFRRPTHREELTVSVRNNGAISNKHHKERNHQTKQRKLSYHNQQHNINPYS